MITDYINIFYQNLPCKVRSVVTENSDGGYSIFINSRLSYEIQYEAAKHEVWHIEHDDFHNKDCVDCIELQAHNII